MTERITEIKLEDTGRIVAIDEHGNQHAILSSADRKWRWKALSIWCVAVMVAMGWGWTALQNSRKASCERTYLSYLKVFAPFAPGPNADQARKDDWNSFKKRTHALAATCGRQVEP